MRNFRPLFVLGCLLVSACHSNQAGREQEAAADTAAAAGTEQHATPSAAASVKTFDISQIPVSDKPLGAFPYFSLPEGYKNRKDKDNTKDFDHFPFWVGDHYQWVEGRIFYNGIDAKEGKQFSKLEVVKNLENLITEAGGVKIFEGKIPYDSAKSLPDEITVGYVDGLGDVYNDPANTYLIHRKDKDIWIHLCISSMSGGWLITESKPFVSTAKMLPEDSTKK